MDKKKEDLLETIQKLREKSGVSDTDGITIKDEGKNHVVLHDELVYAGEALPDEIFRCWIVLKRLKLEFVGPGSDQMFYAPVDIIAKRLGKGTRQVWRIFQKMEELGILRREREKRTGDIGEFNLYQLAEEEDWWWKHGRDLKKKAQRAKEERYQKAPKIEPKGNTVPI
jgi:hypothetical protein